MRLGAFIILLQNASPPDTHANQMDVMYVALHTHSRAHTQIYRCLYGAHDSEKCVSEKGTANYLTQANVYYIMCVCVCNMVHKFRIAFNHVQLY